MLSLTTMLKEKFQDTLAHIPTNNLQRPSLGHESLCTRLGSIEYIRDIMRGSFVHGNSVLMMLLTMMVVMMMMMPGVHLM